MAVIAEELKMRTLLSELLTKNMFQMVNKRNAINFLTTANACLSKKKQEYRQELVAVPVEKKEKKEKRKKSKHNRSSGSDDSVGDDYDDSSDGSSVGSEDDESISDNPTFKQVEVAVDESDLIDEIKDSEAAWREFLNYAIDVTACNLHYIMATCEDAFLKQVSGDVIEMVVNKNLEFYRGNPNYDN